MQYSQKVLDHFMKPHNLGKLDTSNAEATEGSPACGDQVSIWLNVNEDTQVIEDIGFLSYGCASNIATASIITDMAKGKTIAEAKAISWKEAAEELDGLPPVKMHCSVLAVDTLRKAIKNYEIAHHLIESDKGSLNKEMILAELAKILYPKVGEDLISLKMVKYASVNEDGLVTIDVEIPKFDQYRENVADEIREHIEKLPGVKKVTINL
ncbi:MAG: iron-sulfur cluster assembly scaffold protein [Candidatus Cloacimonetes bacterium]|nr:iron-sulfur cluster assembly scaffold protein [Candidatus Cloacimonadota bacterium]